MSEVYRLIGTLEDESREQLGTTLQALGEEPNLTTLNEVYSVVVFNDLIYPQFPDVNQWTVHLPLDISAQELQENLISLTANSNWPSNLGFRPARFLVKAGILSMSLQIQADYLMQWKQLKKELIQSCGFRYLKYLDLQPRIILAKIDSKSEELPDLESLLSLDKEITLKTKGASLSRWADGKMEILEN